MKIVVFGASGGIGRSVVEQLSSAGHSVTAVVRDKRKLAMPASNVDLVEIARLEDPRNLVAAIQGFRCGHLWRRPALQEGRAGSVPSDISDPGGHESRRREQAGCRERRTDRAGA